jgi:DNA-binding XRE family transcriptional regulator
MSETESNRLTRDENGVNKPNKAEFDARMCRTARAWFDMTQHDLAKMADVGVSTVADFERGARDTDPYIIAKLERAFGGLRIQGNLLEDQVEWVVNDIAELGVKIGSQFFWCYKGRSIVYDEPHEDGSAMYWRPVFKREFGECVHPINYKDLTKIGTVSLDDSDDWEVLIPSALAEGPA